MRVSFALKSPIGGMVKLRYLIIYLFVYGMHAGLRLLETPLRYIDSNALCWSYSILFSEQP